MERGESFMAKVVCWNISGLEESEYERLYSAALPERRLRADRYRRREDSLRCLAAGALLQWVVKRELGLGFFTVEYESGGKPRLKEAPDFHYNLSHSGHWVVLAWSEGEIGVDVQQMRADSNRELIARRFFTPGERSYVFEREEDSLSRFYRIWTGKESYLKYLGTGLTKALNSFDVLGEPVAPLLHHSLLGEDCALTVCTGDESCRVEMVAAAQVMPE
jgi:4'-phosphopantetheinyl transferase